MKLKVGFYVDQIAYGGGERVLNMIITYLKQNGHYIDIFTYNDEWLNFGKDYSIHLLYNRPLGINGKIKAFSEIKEKLVEARVDVIVVFSLSFAEVAVWSAKFAKIPILLSERVDPKFAPKACFRRFYKKLLFRYANGIVFQTNEVRNYYLKLLKNKSIVIPNPIIDDNLPDIIFDVRKEIVCVARLSPEKKINLLIEAFSELNRDDYKLLIYGDGPEGRYLEEQIQLSKLSEKVKLLGSVKNVLNHINGADIFVLNSEQEGMPNALIEAMAMGLACISTDFESGGARSLITDRVNGLLINVNNKENLKSSLELLIEDNKLKELIKLNAVKIRETNSKKVIMPHWEKFLYTIVHN